MSLTWRAAVVATLLGLGAAGVTAAQQDETFAGKKVSEWVTILKEHKDKRFRRASLLAMETFGPKARGVAGGLLEALQKDPEPEIRREVAILLGRLGPELKGGAEALGEALKTDKADVVRQAAATALGGKWAEKAGDQVMVLAGALKDKHPGTRAAAAESLRNFGENAKPAVPALLDVAKDKTADRFPRVYAIQIVSRWGTEDAAAGPVLLDILADKAAPTSVREAAAEGLGQFPDVAKAAPALGAALDDPQLDVRTAAAVALAKLGARAQAAWPAIKKTLQDGKADSGVRYQLIRSAALLAKEQPEAVTALAATALNDEAAENRLAAVQELGELGRVAAPAVPTLTRIADGDARASLRQAADAALKKIKGS
jgi:HEAT repeat protein